jgi:hypothetical protein
MAMFSRVLYNYIMTCMSNGGDCHASISVLPYSTLQLISCSYANLCGEDVKDMCPSV